MIRPVKDGRIKIEIKFKKFKLNRRIFLLMIYVRKRSYFGFSTPGHTIKIVKFRNYIYSYLLYSLLNNMMLSYSQFH